jgi:hypothetical protein
MPSRLRVPVEVPPEGQGSDNADDLSVKINQIFVQKGPFRNVTEQSVALGPDIDETESEDDAKSAQSDDETREQRLELLVKTRDELFATIHRGTLQCNQALDFISLFLSKHSRPAQGTFSDVLKQSVKPGMLDALYLDNARYAPTVRPRQELAKGWRTKSFLSASEKFRSASKRLKTEADSQASFWEQVAEVGNNGWKVCRHPRNRREIGVIFGMPESADQFRNQGFVSLQQDADSKLALARKPLSTRVSVAILRSGQVTGKHTPNNPVGNGGLAAVRDLREARDCLLDDELFYELGREARLAANQGIITRGDNIEFTINNQYSVIISLETPTDSPSLATEDASLAKFIALSIRSLLAQAHHGNYLRRTRPPPPISARPSHPAEYAILRPLIATLRHSIAKTELEKQLHERLIQPLQRAGFQISLEPAVPQQTALHANKPQPHSIISIDVREDRYTLKLPSNSVDIKILTYLGRPTYGTQYEILQEDLSRFGDVEGFLDSLTRLAAGSSLAWLASHSSSEELKWKAMQTFRAEMYLDSPKQEDEPLTVRVSLADGTLVARVGGGKMQKQQMWSWTADRSMGGDGESGGEATLLDVVRRVMQEN